MYYATVMQSTDSSSDTAEVSPAFALVRMPFTFMQDDLLNTDGFIRAARERGHAIDHDDLQDLHSRRLLLPLYRASNTPVAGRRLDVKPNGCFDPRFQALELAGEGRLRDCAVEGYCTAWPYERQDDNDDPQWRNGFLYSSWQLLELHRALCERRLLIQLQQRTQHIIPPEQLPRRHNRTLALCALTPRYLPGVLGTLSFPGGVDREALENFRFHADVLGLLRAIDFDPGQLRLEAEFFLLEASGDPLHDWLPLIRHASYDAWKKLRGKPLDYLWLRIGAEVLLRAHEELAVEGHVEALPEAHPSLRGRLGRKNDSSRPLEQVLGNFGLSPHPRVLLVIEGKTERYHVLPLLEQFGLSRPELVRIQQCKGSKVSPQLLARYAVTPRIGKKIGDAWEMVATPTALVIAMDPENKWIRPEDECRKIKDAIREEVELQGGKVGDESLDFQVNVFTWGEDKYELANFNDEELLPALAQLARGNDVGSKEWITRVTEALQQARQDHSDIGVVTGPLRVNKPELANLLWPTLLQKCERELKSGEIETPVLKVMLKVDELVQKLSAGSYVVV